MGFNPRPDLAQPLYAVDQLPGLLGGHLGHFHRLLLKGRLDGALHPAPKITAYIKIPRFLV